MRLPLARRFAPTKTPTNQCGRLEASVSGPKTVSKATTNRAETPIRRQKRLSTREVELLKRTVPKGVSDDEFALFLWVCKKHKLDPMTRQLHCVRRFTQKHHQDEKGIWI